MFVKAIDITYLAKNMIFCLIKTIAEKKSVVILSASRIQRGKRHEIDHFFQGPTNFFFLVLLIFSWKN